uniref:UTP23 sensor motif region domain-containing protein n=1 Tax=Oryza nivara TaxID=4536 RepID=A0A0E0G6E2_ORYNI
MRVKRRSKNRKVVRFYASCFGFREPYRVLVDGTFVHHLLSHSLLPADDALQSLLSASRPPPLFTSKCVLAELRRLGKSHADAFDAAALLATAKCEHDKVVSAVDCILSLIGEKNPEHFFVATQDSDLRAKLREVPGVPVIYGLKSSLFIEQPSVQQRKFAQLDEEKRLHMGKSEYQKLLKVPSDGKAAASENASDDEKNRRPISSLVENALGVADKSKFKKKRPKGPNPLSCKKKKPKPQLSAAQNQINMPIISIYYVVGKACLEELFAVDATQGLMRTCVLQGPKADGEAKRKRVRKRKRSHKDSKQTETMS